MKPLPSSRNALLLRTDFSDDAAWDELRAEIRLPVDGFLANVDFVDDRAYEGITTEQLIQLYALGRTDSFAIVADRTTFARPDRALLIVDRFAAPGREFRALPSRIQSIENNLSIGNMDFAEFA